MTPAPVGPFVPYGRLPREYQPPYEMALGFLGPKGMPATAQEWLDWLEQTADDLKSFLWPRWVGDHWDGDLGLARALTEADLSLMPRLREQLDLPVAANAATHRVLFVAEDLSRPSLGGFMNYIAQAAPQPLLRDFDGLVGEGGGRRGFSAALELKLRMQRPRPYQTTLLLAPAAAFEYEPAVTAVTPSLVSGHALQAAMALATVIVRLEHQIQQKLPQALVEQMQRFFIHVGDRRVFAGVHYPSDNVSSWYTALRLLRRMAFDRPDDPEHTVLQQARARAVLWEAIERHSPVWAAIVDDADKEGSAFRPVKDACRPRPQAAE